MNTEKIAKVKNLVASTGAKLMSIKFLKADGSERVMAFNPKTAKGLKGEDASPPAQQGVITRKKNNPNLINVCDQSLLAKGDPADKCWRSVNCDTAFEAKILGEVVDLNAL